MVIVSTSIKGGVGKSSLVLLLANNLASRGHKVLVVDMDLNNTSTIYYTMGIKNVQEVWERQNIMIAMTQGRVEENIVHSRIKNVDVIPSSLSLCNIRSIDYRVLKKVLEEVKGSYDYIVIDTSPTYDNLVMNAINAADLVLNPVELTEYACNMSLFLMTKIQEELPDKYENTFIIYNKWDERYRTYPNTVQSQVQKLFEKTFGNILDIRLANCYSFNRYTHFDERLKFSAKSKGTVRLVQAVNDLVDQITREKNFIEEF
ncbi:ParA family protein [Treponema sp.]|uniref:ParA family protein n=1 Tax=Treponema sp. TaxID=166 RepID=UPI00388D9339